MSKRTSTLVVRGLLALGLAVLSFTHSAQAATVYSDFGAPPTIYSSTNGWLVAGSASPYGSYSAAMPFTLGVTRKIDYSSVAVALYSGTKTFFVDIRKDCSGVPCPTAMYTWPATVATYSYGSCCAIETTSADADVAALAGHTYWIVVRVKPGSNSVFVWNQNNIGSGGRVAISYDGGATWPTVVDSTFAAFSLDGH